MSAIALGVDVAEVYLSVDNKLLGLHLEFLAEFLLELVDDVLDIEQVIWDRDYQVLEHE